MVRRGPPFAWAIESGLHGDLARQIPDEAGEFSSNSGADLVLMQTACAQAAVALAEAQLRPPRNLAQRSGLGFVTDLQLAGNLCRESVCPSRLDQNATGMRVAGFGDRAQRARLAARAFARYESEKRHELLGVSEASEVTEFGNASPAALRTPMHDSGPMWLARPSMYKTFIYNTLPV
jgi:hypothetical protein